MCCPYMIKLVLLIKFHPVCGQYFLWVRCTISYLFTLIWIVFTDHFLIYIYEYVISMGHSMAMNYQFPFKQHRNTHTIKLRVWNSVTLLKCTEPIDRCLSLNHEMTSSMLKTDLYLNQSTDLATSGQLETSEWFFKFQWIQFYIITHWFWV